MYSTQDAIDYDTGQNYTEYILQCLWGTHANAMQPWVVARRFREFDTLDTALRDAFPQLGSKLSDLPPKTFLPWDMTSSTVLFRLQKLESYIRRIVTDPVLRPLLMSRQMDTFLEISQRLRLMKDPSRDPVYRGQENGASEGSTIAQQAPDAGEPATPLTEPELRRVEGMVQIFLQISMNHDMNQSVDPTVQRMLKDCQSLWPRVQATGNPDTAVDPSLIARALQCDEDYQRSSGTLLNILAFQKTGV